MERSSSLEAWARDLFASTDPERLVDAHSGSDDVLVIGTDEDEWVEGGDAVAAAWRSQDLAGIEVDDVRCYEEGTVAWMVARVRFQLPDGSELPARVTGVAHKERGDWKIVQSHSSAARPT
jgi:ketosteroid isomerase-like protein